MLPIRFALFLLCTVHFTYVLGKSPWWLKLARHQGPMVCAEEYVPDSERHFSIPWTGGSLCGSEAIIRYACCPGYSKVRGEIGCPLVKPLKNLAETAQEFGFKKFIEHAEQAGILPLLSDRGPYTLFVAPDAAFDLSKKEREKSHNSSKRFRSRPPILLYTVAEGRMTAENLPDSLTTLYREGSVAVTRFPNGLTTVNCIPLIATNIEATNGLIHVTESLLLPPGRSTIPDVLTRTPVLSTTAAAIVRAQLANYLRDKRPLTIFAPTDEAWESLPQSFMEALMDDASSLKVLLQYHILEELWCPAIASHTTELKTLGGKPVTISCNFTGHHVNDAHILHSNHRAGNGLIHHIDSVLIPENVFSLAEYLEFRKMKYFLQLAKTANLLKLLERSDSYTVFVPHDDAFEDIPIELLSNLVNVSSAARQIISLHMIPGRLLTTNIIDGQKFTPVENSGSQLRVKFHKKRLTVESALAEETDLETRNGVIHILDRVLFPATLSLADQLIEDDYSIFIKLLNSTEPNLLKLLDNSTSTFTVFAVSDSQMNKTVPGFIPRLLVDPPLLYEIMAHHIISGFVVSSSLEPLLTYSFTTVNDHSITITKENDGYMTVARLAQVIRPDVLATNGVMHEVSRLIEF